MGISISNCYERKSSNEDLTELEKTEETKRKSTKYKDIKKIIQKFQSQNENNSENYNFTDINFNTEIKIAEKRKSMDLLMEVSSFKNRQSDLKIKKSISNYNLNNNYYSHNPSSKTNILIKSEDLLKPTYHNVFIFYEDSHRQKFNLHKSFLEDSINENKIYLKIEDFLSKKITKNKPIGENEFSFNGLIEVSSDNSTSSEDTKIKNFLILTNEFIYQVSYNFKNENLQMLLKILNVSIDFISITSNTSKVFLHINTKMDNKTGIFEVKGISKELNLNFVYGVCNNCFNNFSQIKNVVVIPNEYFIRDNKITQSGNFKKMNENLATFSELVYNSLIKELPFDINEVIIKIIPIVKVETKFTEIKTQILLLITNKRIIEVLDKRNFKSKNIFQFSKLKSITIFKKENKLELEFEDFQEIVNYNSIMVSEILKLIKVIHSKECLNDVIVIKN